MKPVPTPQSWIEFYRFTAYMRSRGWKMPFIWRRRSVLPVGAPSPAWCERYPQNDNAPEAA